MAVEGKDLDSLQLALGILGILVRVPETFHKLHPVLRPGAENSLGAAGKNGKAKVAAPQRISSWSG